MEILTVSLLVRTQLLCLQKGRMCLLSENHYVKYHLYLQISKMLQIYFVAKWFWSKKLNLCWYIVFIITQNKRRQNPTHILREHTQGGFLLFCFCFLIIFINRIHSSSYWRFEVLCLVPNSLAKHAIEEKKSTLKMFILYSLSVTIEQRSNSFGGWIKVLRWHLK